MIEPEAAVYWRRRAVAVGVVVGLVLLVVWAVSGPSQQPQEFGQAAREMHTASSTELSEAPSPPDAATDAAPAAGEPVSSPSLLPLPPSNSALTANSAQTTSSQTAPRALPNPGTQPGATNARPGAQPGVIPGATGTTQPGTQAATQPGAQAMPGATQPGATQPGATQPGATQPGATQPGATQPGATQPGATQPGTQAMPGTLSPSENEWIPERGRMKPEKPAKPNVPGATNGEANPESANLADPASLPKCADKDMGLVAQVDEASYRTGQRPVFRLVIANLGKTACSRDLDPGLQELVVSSTGGNRVWSSNDCFPERKSDLRALLPGKTVQFPVSWSARGSAPGCAAARSEVPAGSYQVIGKLGSLTSSPARFTIAGGQTGQTLPGQTSPAGQTGRTGQTNQTGQTLPGQTGQTGQTNQTRQQPQQHRPHTQVQPLPAPSQQTQQQTHRQPGQVQPVPASGQQGQQTQQTQQQRQQGQPGQVPAQAQPRQTQPGQSQTGQTQPQAQTRQQGSPTSLTPATPVVDGRPQAPGSQP